MADEKLSTLKIWIAIPPCILLLLLLSLSLFLLLLLIPCFYYFNLLQVQKIEKKCSQDYFNNPSVQIPHTTSLLSNVYPEIWG